MESKNGTDYLQNYDFVVKWLAEALEGETLDVFGIKTAPVEEVFAFEPMELSVKAGRVDVMVRDREGALFHIEEQRDLKRSDLYRFAAYHFLGAKKWGPGLLDVILASGEVSPGDMTVQTESGRYTPQVIDFSKRDGVKRLREIREEVAAGTFTNWLELVILPLYGKQKGEERTQFVEEVVLFQATLFRENKISSRLPAATLILANKMIDKKRLIGMWEVIKMLDIIEIAVEKGREEGSVFAAREMLIDLFTEKFGVVPSSTQEEISRIESIFNLKSLFRQILKCSDIDQAKALVQRLQNAEAGSNPL